MNWLYQLGAQIPTPAADLLDSAQLFTDTWSLTPSIMAPVAVLFALGLAFAVARKTIKIGKSASR